MATTWSIEGLTKASQGDSIIKINAGKDFLVTDDSDSTLFGVDEATGLLAVSSGANITGLLDIKNDIVRLQLTKTPTSASDTGTTGDICWDASYVYVCIATDTWKRAGISTW